MTPSPKFKTLFQTVLSRLRSLRIFLRPMVKRLFIASLVAVLTFGPASSALAARSGGRIGGGSFRRSAPSYSGGGRSYSGGSGYRSGGYGGGVGFPFLIPFFGFGGGLGSLFALMIGFAIINYLANTLRGMTDGGGDRPMVAQRSGRYGSSLVSVAQVRVGLLAQARSLQKDLDRMAQTADTGTAAGRSQVLQEATLSLLRHPLGPLRGGL